MAINKIEVHDENLGHLANITMCEDGSANLERLSKYSYFYLGRTIEVFPDWVDYFLQSRVFKPKNERLTKKLLDKLDLDEYNIEQIARKTQGRNITDGMYLVFIDE